MTNRIPPTLARFATDARGTVAVSKLFVGAVAVAVCVTGIALVGFGADAAAPEPISPFAEAEAAFRAEHYGRDRATVMAEGPRQYFSGDDIRSRYGIFSDPDQTSIDDLRSAHRTWARRMDDHAYSQPGRASDMIMILEHALEARGLEPHDRF